MTGKLIRNKWPKDTAARLEKMCAEKKTWEQMGTSFGCSSATIRKKAIDLGAHVPKRLRRFTPEDDALMRADYLANVDIHITAAKIGCSWGVLRQRLFHFHKDIINTVRTAAGTKALKRYGAELMQHGATAGEAAANIREKIIRAKTEAKISAVTARLNRKEAILDEMVASVEAGKDRNIAIFETRMLGVALQDIADRVDITRERVRQICDEVAFKAAIEKQISEHSNPQAETAASPKLSIVGAA